LLVIILKPLFDFRLRQTAKNQKLPNLYMED